MLKATLATDAVIGSMSAPSDPGSAYVLLHHIMGEAAGKARMRVVSFFSPIQTLFS